MSAPTPAISPSDPRATFSNQVPSPRSLKPIRTMPTIPGSYEGFGFLDSASSLRPDSFITADSIDRSLSNSDQDVPVDVGDSPSTRSSHQLDNIPEINSLAEEGSIRSIASHLRATRVSRVSW